MGMTQQQQKQHEEGIFDLWPVQQSRYSSGLLQYVDDAARILRGHWPRGGSVDNYHQKMLGSSLKQAECISSLQLPTVPNGDCDRVVVTLPCSYLLIHKKKVVAHGRLTSCFEGAGGNAVAATYIIAEPRGQGYGSILMTLLEKEAIQLGYHYVYLWTTTAISFYSKLGYSKTDRVSLHSACLKTLHSDQVGVLETMLAKRSFCKSATHHNETIMLPPDATAENDVWLRKRLVESVASTMIPIERRMEEFEAAIQQCTEMLRWEYFMHSIPWQQQLGPSCGLAALRMLRDYYIVLTETNANVKMPSLLAEAQVKNYSKDGEIFDARNIVKLADFCGLHTELRSFQQMRPKDIMNLLKDGGALILPYDSQPLTRRPWLNGGKSAHYGIIVGMLLGFQLDVIDSDKVNTPSCMEMVNFETVNSSDHVLLLVQHSLSSTLSIAKYTDFFDSNQQLTSIDTAKCKLPDGGVLNLTDCAIICHGLEIVS
jgi:N-acetylglutamate synthase-like GNAT family acetyltransferase